MSLTVTWKVSQISARDKDNEKIKGFREWKFKNKRNILSIDQSKWQIK